jgi:chromosome segregation protein
VLQFNRLRLTGFKSFVEPTDLLIETGLTGVVGPNGCGKSNLVEALRWVMGETSAKQMRGGEMDDVIFGGTASRPGRNIAEVALLLDNAARAAPSQFNDTDMLEVVRRIKRGEGSVYRVNGKDVRARDVQILFADSATGARSTALVSQGRVGALINAKPADRRMLLEEAAGITGLHSRRHEAEIRLRAAETNLKRVDDVLQTLDAQLQNLKKQTRQTARYRNLSQHIRAAEATYFYLRWRSADAELDEAKWRLASAESEVTERTRAAAEAATAQAERAAGLPDLRQAEAAAAAELQRLIIAREQLDAEERRLEESRREIETRLAHIAQDMEREERLRDEAAAAVRRLAEERAAIETAQAGEGAARDEAENRLRVAAEAVAAEDLKLARLTHEVAEAETRRQALARARGELEDRIQRLAARTQELAEGRARLEADAVALAAAAEADAAAERARLALAAARGEVEAAETARAQAEAARATAEDSERAAHAALANAEAEESALARLLEAGAAEAWPPVIDAIGVDEGYEAALGAALGEDLSASADEAAPVRWRALPPLADAPALPQGAVPLARFVRAPAALARRLAQIGVVASEAEGQALAAQLRPGQRLISRDGGLWRWDGFIAKAGAATPAATRLEQRSRLKAVRAILGGIRSAFESAREAADAARAEAALRLGNERDVRARLAAAEDTHGQARDAALALRQKIAEQTSRLAALADQARADDDDLAEARADAKTLADEIAALPNAGAARAKLDALRQHLARARAEERERQAACEALVRTTAERVRRLDDIARESRSWKNSEDNASGQIAKLVERRAAAEDEQARLAGRPAEIAEHRRSLMGAIEASEGRRRAAADRLALAENALAEADKELRAAEARLAEGREERVRAEGLLEQAKVSIRALTERVAERLDAPPERLAEIADIAEGDELPEIAEVEKKLERLQRERETMGPVNLRAEQEADELTRQIETMQAERADLVAAIDKLRKAIQELNREGRERLLKSFTEVDKHFQQLFTRLFGGGRAHLALVESDDPLEAGLEVMASPPGKRLQTLSLLSGGEQALTALALLFGVFLTNPAPICVLDEVDAPLDDANVDRFCTLLEEIARSGGTRFLVVTHHRMTMARMDRLFGVTMQERGVSQLVSVDLQKAEELRDSVLAA